MPGQTNGHKTVSDDDAFTREYRRLSLYSHLPVYLATVGEKKPKNKLIVD